jgi:hypothetical protein
MIGEGDELGRYPTFGVGELGIIGEEVDGDAEGNKLIKEELEDGEFGEDFDMEGEEGEAIGGEGAKLGDKFIQGVIEISGMGRGGSISGLVFEVPALAEGLEGEDKFLDMGIASFVEGGIGDRAIIGPNALNQTGDKGGEITAEEFVSGEIFTEEVPEDGVDTSNALRKDILGFGGNSELIDLVTKRTEKVKPSAIGSDENTLGVLVEDLGQLTPPIGTKIGIILESNGK